MTQDNVTAALESDDSNTLSRRLALMSVSAFGLLSMTTVLPAAAQGRSQVRGGTTLLSKKAGNEFVGGSGSLVVALWEAKEGQAEAVTAILRRFLPQAQNEPGVKLFLIGRGKDNPAQFVFYELFVDDAAIAAHRASDHFKTMIVGEALPLLSKRESTQYVLL